MNREGEGVRLRLKLRFDELKLRFDELRWVWGDEMDVEVKEKREWKKTAKVMMKLTLPVVPSWDDLIGIYLHST